MTMTVAPPVVQPSPGLMALMQGVAAGRQERSQVRGSSQGGHWGLAGSVAAGGPDLQRGPGGVPCGHASSCCAQTCCQKRPTRVHPRSLSWTPPPGGRAKASLIGALGGLLAGLLWGTSNLKPVAGCWNSGSLAWGRASAPQKLSWWKGGVPAGSGDILRCTIFDCPGELTLRGQKNQEA